MKNVIILGESGNIAKHVIDILVNNDDINLTLFLRDARRLRNQDVSISRVVEGDAVTFPSPNSSVHNGCLAKEIEKRMAQAYDALRIYPSLKRRPFLNLALLKEASN